MVADRLPFAVLVGRDVDGVALFGQILDLLDDGAVIFVDAVLGLETVVFDLDAETVFGQVADVPFGGDHFVIFTQKVLDRPRLGG